MAVEGETVEQDRRRVWIERKAEWYYEFTPYDWRWRMSTTFRAGPMQGTKR